jgi:hypothetical protein
MPPCRPGAPSTCRPRGGRPRRRGRRAGGDSGGLLSGGWWRGRAAHARFAGDSCAAVPCSKTEPRITGPQI